MRKKPSKGLTPEQDQTLTRLWRSGLWTVEDLCQHFGAGIGVIRRAKVRLKLPAKPTIADLKARGAPCVSDGCQWIIGDRPDWRMCGAAKLMGQPYCQEHHDISRGKFIRTGQPFVLS